MLVGYIEQRFILSICYIASNKKLYHEWEIGKKLSWAVQGILAAFVWTDWGKPWTVSVAIIGIQRRTEGSTSRMWSKRPNHYTGILSKLSMVSECVLSAVRERSAIRKLWTQVPSRDMGREVFKLLPLRDTDPGAGGGGEIANHSPHYYFQHSPISCSSSPEILFSSPQLWLP